MLAINNQLYAHEADSCLPLRYLLMLKSNILDLNLSKLKNSLIYTSICCNDIISTIEQKNVWQ